MLDATNTTLTRAGPERRALWRRRELPTWGVALTIHAGFVALTWWHQALPWWLLAPLGAILIAWHGSLQHEAVHGHPTRSERLNGLIAGLPLSLWLPFPLYRAWHRAHHDAAVLACPRLDPESFYVTAEDWRRAGPLTRCLLRAVQTLAGRLVLGPPWMVALFWKDEALRLWRGDTRHRAAWLAHAAGLVLVLGWLCWLGLPLWFYVLAMVWPGVGLTLLRSYHEHRPAAAPQDRSATLHAAWPLALLYLNNNLHAAHHARPGLAWYELPRFNREGLAAKGYQVAGYASLFRRYLLRPKDEPVYPY